MLCTGALAHKLTPALTLHAKPIEANDSMAICERKGSDFLARYCRSCNSINQHTLLLTGWLADQRNSSGKLPRGTSACKIGDNAINGREGVRALLPICSRHLQLSMCQEGQQSTGRGENNSTRLCLKVLALMQISPLTQTAPRLAEETERKTVVMSVAAERSVFSLSCAATVG